METEIYWKAVQENDARLDGAFFYGVSSTGVYCRPSCRSRRPKRENVEFFADAREAEARGFRACLRCRPAEAETSPQTRSILEACRLLETEDDLSLADLGARLNLSAAHLRKIFKDVTGVSPKKYAERLRLEKFKREVRSGAAVTEALYEAGFGSSSRLYEKSAERLGMTPKAYAKKGKSERIAYTVVRCELGLLLAARTAKGVCAVAFGDDETVLTNDLAEEFANALVARDDAGLRPQVDAILAHLDGGDKRLELPLDVRATAFQQRVWEELRKIPYGETAGYREIAERIGRPSAARAVASACASNPVALLIPCHRVVRAGGGLSGYRWGVERKKRILEKEKSEA